MLAKMGNLGGLFGPKADHPLADARELRRVLSEIPMDNAFKALDEISGWLDSLQGVAGFPANLLFEVVRQLDDAAQPHLRRLARDYLHTQRLSRSEEKRLWDIVRGLWAQLAGAYESCLAAATAAGRPADILKAALPLLCARIIVALGTVNKWDCFHYAPLPPAFWKRLGHAYKVSVEAGLATESLQLYPLDAGSTDVQQEYVKVLACQVSSMDCLPPAEIELAERLIAHFLPLFALTATAGPGSTHWVDLNSSQGPMRLLGAVKEKAPSQRFLQPAGACSGMDSLLLHLETEGSLPTELNLGIPYQVRNVLPVLRHLATCLATEPPKRQHDRHRVKHCMAVLNGLVNAFVVFSRELGGKPSGLQMENWEVENVSLGGFGAVVNTAPAEWLKVGILLALQPEGGENWLLGIIRRCQRESASGTRVGIEWLARQAASVELKPHASAGNGAAAHIPALLILDAGEPGEMRFVLPPGAFHPKDSLEFNQGGQCIVLSPSRLVERAGDYEVACYRVDAGQ